MTRIVVALACTALIGGCAPADEHPVATPSVTVMPDSPVMGAPFDMAFTFEVPPDAAPAGGDYRVFVHFLNPGGRLLWTYDHQPASPTSGWKPGTRIAYTRTTFMPVLQTPREITVEVGLFDPRTGARAPLKGERGGNREYMVASFTPQRDATQHFISFTQGWHATETAGEESVDEWRWSSREATLSFRNPQRDLTLFLELDQPSNAVPMQQVDVRVGATALGTFTLQPGTRDVQKIPLPAAALGSERSSQITLTTEPTFVPAKTAGGTDTRELGFRLFHAYLGDQ